MSIISKCPKCHALVTIPAGLDPDAEVRCPLCVVVYPLREALAEVPPALIPVDTGAITGPRGGSDALAKSDLVAEPYHVAELPSASKGAATTTELSPAEAPTTDAWQEVDAASEVDTRMADEASPAIDTGQTPVDSDALARFSIEESQQYQPFAGDASMRARRKKEKGALRFLVEVFLGGVVGLTIGYYVLCWVLGPRHGLPELPLPLLPHTMHWFKDAEKPDDATGQPSAGEPDMPRRQPQTQPPGPVREDVHAAGI